MWQDRSQPIPTVVRGRGRARAWSRGLALALFLLAVRPAAAPGQPGTEPVESVIELRGKTWTDSGIDVVAGERLVLKAEGEFGFANSGVLGPEGMSGTVVEGPPLPDAPFGAVIGRIGDTLFAVGAGAERIVETGGRLQLGVNIPDRYQKVPYSFRVAITVIRVPPPLLPDKPPVRSEAAPTGPEPTEHAAAPAEVSAPAATATAKLRPVPPSPPVEPADAEESSFPWLLLLGVLAAAMAAVGLSQWHRARLSARTQARLAIAHSLSPEAAERGRPPPEIAPAWPTVGTRWRMDEKEPAFGSWIGEEARDG
jgi:hypothetical protein